MPTVLAVRHIACEDLGTLGHSLKARGFKLRYFDVGIDSFDHASPLDCELVVVLGGPISACDTDKYPFIQTEIRWLRARLIEDLPTLGIGLGAQMMAAALHARVYSGAFGKEIGWTPLQPGPDAACLPAFQRYLDSAAPVLHWQRDTFDLPSGARHLAGSFPYANQAFLWGQNCLALQFQAQFDPHHLERWLISHSEEIAQADGVTVDQLRHGTGLHAEAAATAAACFWDEWIASFARKRPLIQESRESRSTH